MPFSPELALKKLRKQEEALRQIRFSNTKYIIGVDEVGTGSWAGPIVVVGAVFYKGWGHPNVGDSKKFKSHKARKRVLPLIEASCKYYSICESDARSIDHYGMGNTLRYLTVKAVRDCIRKFKNSIVVLDGNDKYSFNDVEVVSLIKADDLIPAVGAASIIAKVHRDEHMKQLAKTYPEYDFESNVGYRSPKHDIGLQVHGPCDIHRLSYRPVKEATRALGKRLESNRGRSSRKGSSLRGPQYSNQSLGR